MRDIYTEMTRMTLSKAYEMNKREELDSDDLISIEKCYERADDLTFIAYATNLMGCSHSRRHYALGSLGKDGTI